MPEQIQNKPEQTKAISLEVVEVERTTTPEIPASPAGTENKESAESTLQATNTKTATVNTIPNPTEIQRIADIERILEEDLSEVYFQLSETDKTKFRTTGEQAAKDINVLLASATVTLKKIIDVITGWLKLIPGVSKFFLEQEAKIKADRLLKLHNHD